MHHAIWVEHDGSWTWSIEEGKAFEDDHKVLQRNDGFPTRGDAKEDMMKAWARLLDEGKKPGRIKGVAKPALAASGKKGTPKTNPHVKAMDPGLPSWAVVVDGTIIALLQDEDAATAYASVGRYEGAEVLEIQLGAVPKLN